MKLKYISAAIAISMVGLAGIAYGQKKSEAETGLLGIKLYSTGLTVVERFGTPDSIEAVNVGGTVGGGGAGGFGRPGGAGGPGMPGRPGMPPGGIPGVPGGGPAGVPMKYGQGSGLDFANSLLQMKPTLGPGAGGPPGGMSGRPGMPPGVPGGAGGPGVPGGAGGQSTGVLFTRWIYNRGGCQYAFIFDKFNRVVQIEAVGLNSSLAHTIRGIRLGATIAQVIRKYEYNPGHELDAPEYDINGDTITLKFLTKNHVAFRFSRIQTGHPQVCTGIAVAAGKY